MKGGLIILQRIIPHYRRGFFEKLSKRNPEVIVLYGQPYKGEPLKNATDLDKNIFVELKNYYFGRNGKIFLSGIYRKIWSYKPKVIVSVFNTGNLNIYILFLLKSFLGFRIILWSFGYDPALGFDPKKRVTDKIRLFLSQKADAVIFYWGKGRDEVAKFSKKTEHYFIAPNTLDTEKLMELKEGFDKTGREAIKKELDIKEQFHFVYVGRLLKDKQLEFLLEAFRILEGKRNDSRLTIIGDGPEKENLKELSGSLKLKSIKFAGEILEEEITGKWIYASDAFIMPGRLGLSVVHAFCFGTPVISQQKKNYFHGEGVGYIKEGVNGFLTEDGNSIALAEKMEEVISTPELSRSLRYYAFETAKNECSVEKMMDGFEEAIKYTLRKE